MINLTILQEVIFVILFLICSILICEFLTRKFRIKPSVSRKIIHIFGACSIALLSFFVNFKIFIFVALIFIPILVFARYKKLHCLADRREKSWGEVLFPVGVFVAAIILPSSESFAVAMFILGISDTAAFIFGTNIKSIKLIFNKTLIGSVVFLISALVISLFFVDFKIALYIAIVTTLAELTVSKGFDNVTIPLAASIILAINV